MCVVSGHGAHCTGPLSLFEGKFSLPFLFLYLNFFLVFVFVSVCCCIGPSGAYCPHDMGSFAVLGDWYTGRVVCVTRVVITHGRVGWTTAKWCHAGERVLYRG